MDPLESDRRGLSLKADLSRREMIAATGLAAGFALAAQPIAAQTAIVTDLAGLEAGEVRVETADGHIPAYRAMPAGNGPFPVLLVVHEIFGVHEHIKDICRRLAKVGYMAVAPELYARQGDVSRMPDSQQILREVVSKVPDAQLTSDLDAAAAFARDAGKGDMTRFGITGFCWGSRVVWLYAAHNPNLKAAVAWYGRLVGQATAMTPRHPVQLAAELKAPVLGLYGGADQGIPVSTVEQMKQACAAANKICEFVIYPDAPHAFNADYRPTYREGPAKDGWRRMLAWFKAHGVA